jgi:hypothetical protein
LINITITAAVNRALSYISIPFFYLLGGFFIVYHMMGDILFRLNEVQLDRSGDGFKNYFAFAWQYKHEDGLFFRGMQYPYGDMLAYADGQPLMTILCIGLKKIGLDLSGYELLIVQGLPILSMAAGFYFLHKIIRYYKVPQWWSVITVISCIMLSPQIFRFNAHFALAYLFCFPSIWYLYVRYERKKIHALLFILTTSMLLFLYAYLHPYHLLIACSFLVGIFIIQLLFRRFDWPIIIAGLLPIAMYLIINHITDPYIDRPQNPWGAWHYKTELGDLMPFYGWFSQLFSSVGSFRSVYHEGYSYLGILLFLFPILFIYKKIKKDLYTSTLSTYPTIPILSALLVLLFSMGIHILITDHKILDWISTLKQFRALGRFAWPYYYVGFIGLSIFSYRIINGLRYKWVKIFLFIFIITMWLIDGLYYSKHFRNNMHKYKAPNELYENKAVSNAIGSQININDYQAILPLPVSMEGAEKVTPSNNWFTKIEGIPYAYQSGLPIIGAYMSRTSLSRILKQYQLGSSSYVQKEIINDLPNRKSIITLIAKNEVNIYSDIVEKSTFLGETKFVNVYSTSIDSLTYLETIPNDSLAQTSTSLYYNNYEEDNTEGLYSKGSQHLDGTITLADIEIAKSLNDTLTLSTWYRIDADHSSVPKFQIIISDDKQNTISDIHYRDLDMKRMEVINNWVQIKQDVILPPDSHKLKWTVSAEQLYIDHTIITSQEQLFWSILSDNYIIYDHYIAQLKPSNLDTEN